MRKSSVETSMTTIVDGTWNFDCFEILAGGRREKQFAQAKRETPQPYTRRGELLMAQPIWSYFNRTANVRMRRSSACEYTDAATQTRRFETKPSSPPPYELTTAQAGRPLEPYAGAGCEARAPSTAAIAEGYNSPARPESARIRWDT